MQRIPVDSSDLVSIGYDLPGKLLEVEFKGGRVYRYREVEPDIHTQFMRAESYGQFFFAHINGRYRYDKIENRTASNPAVIALVTSDTTKTEMLRLICAPFNIEIEQLELPVDKIQSDDAEEIVIKKAKQAYKIADRPVIVHESLWSILALRGFPGAYMDILGRWLQSEDILKLLEGKNDRSVYLADTVAYYDGKRLKVFTAKHTGIVALAAAGEGAPMERVVIMTGQTKTLAQLTAEAQYSIPLHQTVWHEVAKWLNMQRRLRRL